jgi:two-component system, OmpR family, alkaline phosphatase synthesis response regulator PhoP
MAKTIMVVDDDPYILVAVEKFLKTKGFKVVCMADPEEAYHAAQKQKPDLIISDVAMPGLDGFTLLKGLKQNKATQQIPLVLLTATDKIADVEKGFEVGAQAYILKPIDWDRAWAKLEPFLK